MNKLGMKIIIVDDHILFREGLVNLLSSQADMQVIADVGTGQEAIKVAIDLNPDLVLMDVGLPDMQGFDAVKQILTVKPDLKVVMLTVHESDDLLIRSIVAGAKGYLIKNLSMNQLFTSLRSLEKGEWALSRAMTGKVLEEFTRIATALDQSDMTATSLTARETEVLGKVGEGLDNQEIGQLLDISENTVRVHIHNIFEKLNLRSRGEAINFARRNNLAKM
jgi:DNA-binding NarL/FixJ family response regulator